MGQTSANWRSPGHCGLDPWLRMGAGVDIPEQLCVSCESVDKLCLLCGGTLLPEIAKTL